MLRPPPWSTLFPYTTLFRSDDEGRLRHHLDEAGLHGGPRPQGSFDVPGPHRRRLRTILVGADRSEEHTSELQSRRDLVCRLLLEKKKNLNEGVHVCEMAQDR